MNKRKNKRKKIYDKERNHNLSTYRHFFYQVTKCPFLLYQLFNRKWLCCQRNNFWTQKTLKWY